MSYKIGFSTDPEPATAQERSVPNTETEPAARKSLVKVYFEERDAAYTYYNDQFDLKSGDRVWVDGKLEGVCGIVTEISYCFKIKLSDYKKVIGVADTAIRGEFRFLGPYFISSDGSIPFSRIRTWFLPPENSEDEYVTVKDGTGIDIHHLKNLVIDDKSTEKGAAYFEENRVAYIGLDHGKGTAIVIGSRPYTVEFDYQNGEISGLTCDCFCTGTCKHEFAVILTLRNMIDFCESNYPDIDFNGYFAAIRKADFLQFAVSIQSTGSFIFG